MDKSNEKLKNTEQIRTNLWVAQICNEAGDIVINPNMIHGLNIKDNDGNFSVQDFEL